MRKATRWLLVCGLLFFAVAQLAEYLMRRRQSHSESIITQAMLEIEVPKGKPQKVELPDNTTVWLNGASKLSYPPNMADGPRTVQLRGEALFEVTQRTAEPFRVKARNMQIEVLGTRFNVRNYEEENFCQTAVVNGKVKVAFNDTAVLLHPGEEAVLNVSELNGAVLQIKHLVDTAMTTAWTKRLLRYRNVPLVYVLHDLSRAFADDIQVRGDLSGDTITASFSVDDSLEEIVRELNSPKRQISLQRVGQKAVITIKKR